MSSYLRKRVRGLLKTTFTTNTNTVEDAKQAIPPAAIFQTEFADNSVIYERILNGRNGKKVEIPETYSGKTGHELPMIHLGEMKKLVKACHTGPDGGLTKVSQMRQQSICRIANLDDELSLSSIDEFEEDPDKTARLNPSSMNNSKSLEALGFLPEDLIPTCSTVAFDWSTSHHVKAYGHSISLYERHPITGINAGTPIADVFGVVARENNAIIALADGVNWGEGARLAARCAVRGAIDHLNELIEKDGFETTTDVFHEMLGAFHAGHSLILQEGGALTTLCVALVAPIKNSDSYVLCVCNVGDSLCFVYNAEYGVREVTLGSHDTSQNRDMRDAGGALGPVDGRNPQLHNLTCSMTFVQPDDLVFITSDGVSDNFDPVVGKFCVIKKTEFEKENDQQRIPVPPHLYKTKSMPSPKDTFMPGFARNKRCTATVPSVDALERHDLMLLRMADVIANGVKPEAKANPYDTPESGIGTPSSQNTLCSTPTASEVVKNLISFAQKLSTAKRKTLEDPQLYRTLTHSRTEERLRRKMVRGLITEMPGKLDHASVVAFKVGEWEPEHVQNEASAETPVAMDVKMQERDIEEDPRTICSGRFCRPSEFATAGTLIIQEELEHLDKHIILHDDLPFELEPDFDKALQQSSPFRRSTRSPYEEPLTIQEVPSPTRVVNPRQNKKSHGRGSQLRHTVGIDVAWLKKLVTTKTESNADMPLAAHSSKLNSQMSITESPLSPTIPGSRHQRPSFSADQAAAPRQFSFKRFFIKSTKSEAVVPPFKPVNR